jgi:serine/threonine protein kinase/WD40 repeat protein
MTDQPGAPIDDSLVGQIAGEFTERLQRGERPDVEDYAQRYPALAELLREALPALQAMLPARPPTLTPPEPLSGRLGDYRLLREVGRGGMGIVYEAEQISLGRRVAVKVLALAAALDARQLQRFQNEARAAAGLHHTNIVPVYAVGTERGVHYFAMQFIDGQTLADVIRERRLQEAGKRDRTPKAGKGDRTPKGKGPSPVSSAVPADSPPVLAGEGPAVPNGDASTRPLAALTTEGGKRSGDYYRAVARVGAQAAEALEHAHQVGIVHRDIKPANLLLDERGNLWVTDFGLARLHGQDTGLTLTGDLVGTLRYMSPEQTRAGRTGVDHRSDIYSLGVTLYELLALRPAFPAVERAELLQQILGDDPVPPRRLQPAVPAELETIILKAMSKNPEERYHSAQDLADDLRRFLDDKPILARPPTTWQKFRRWGRRHRRLVVSLSTSAAVLLAALVIGPFYYAVEQRQLALERDEFAQKQEEKNREFAARLYGALLDRATATRRERRPGYRRVVWNDLQAAALLEDAPKGPKDRERIINEVVACLGDPISLGPADLATAGRPPEPKLSWELVRLVQANKSPWDGTYAETRDQRLWATGGGREVNLWEIRTGKRLGHKVSPLGFIHDLEFTPDGKLLAAGCDEGAVLWSVPGLEQVSFTRAGSVFSLAIHPNGRLLAISGRQIELWSIPSGRPVLGFDTPVPGALVQFSLDGKYLFASHMDNQMRRHVLAAWPVLDTPEKRTLEGHQAGVPALAFSPDGKLLVSASKDRLVKIWNVAGGEPGDASNRELLHSCPGHDEAIEALAFSPDGRLLATGDFSGRLYLWDVAKGAKLNRLFGPGPIYRLQFDPAGRYLACAGSKGVMAWALRGSDGSPAIEPLLTLSLEDVRDLAVDPRGSELVFPDTSRYLIVYDIAHAAGPLHLDVSAAHQYRGLTFDATGQLLFVAPSGTIATWDRRDVHRTGQKAYHLAVSPGGRWVATSTFANEVILYDRHTDQTVLTFPAEAGEVWSLAWNPEGTRLAVGTSDGGVAVWDLRRIRHELAKLRVSLDWELESSGAPAPPASPQVDRLLEVHKSRKHAEEQQLLAQNALARGDLVAGQAALLEALKTRDQLARELPAGGYHLHELARVHGALGRACAMRGDVKKARTHGEQHTAIAERLVAEYPGVRDYAEALAESHSNAALLFEQEGRLADAMAAVRQGLRLCEDLARRCPDLRVYGDRVAMGRYRLAYLLNRNGEAAEAERVYRQVLDLVVRLHGTSQPCTQYGYLQACMACAHDLGTLLEKQGRLKDAEDVYRRAVAFRKSVDKNNGWPFVPRDCQSDLGATLERLALLRSRRGDNVEARGLLEDAVKHQRVAWRAVANVPMYAQLCAFYRQRCAGHCRHLAETQITLGQHPEASRSARNLAYCTPGSLPDHALAAALLFRCAALAADDAKLPMERRRELAQVYVAEGVKTLWRPW